VTKYCENIKYSGNYFELKLEMQVRNRELISDFKISDSISNSISKWQSSK